MKNACQSLLNAGFGETLCVIYPLCHVGQVNGIDTLNNIEKSQF